MAVTASLAAGQAALFTGATPTQVVLGSTTSFVPYGVGWGTSKPDRLDNGGDPTGRVWNLRWKHWGATTALGDGLTFLSPTSKHGWVTGRAELRASHIARCSPTGPAAYTRLEVRVALLKAGVYTAWSLWNDRPNLCHPA
jgi:hypothetical protein